MARQVPQGEGAVEEMGRLLRHHDPSQLVYQLHEIFRERTYLRHGIEVGEGDVVFDVGANVGVAAAFFASECRAGRVHCFEPVAPLFELLRENLRHFPAAVAHEYGLSSRAGRAEITYYPGASSMSGLYADPEEDREFVRDHLIANRVATEQEADRRLRDAFDPVTLTCELRPLSSVLRDEGVDRVDLLKIDVEKAELDVLGGIEERDWPRIEQLVVEVHDIDDRCRKISRLLAARGFRLTSDQDARMRGTAVHVLYATRT